MHSTRLWAGLSRGVLSRSSTTRTSAPTLRNFFTTSHPPAKPQLRPSSLQRSLPFLFRSDRTTLSRPFRSLRFKSDLPPSQRPNPTPHLGSPEPAPSLSQRLKKLSREYGWAAFGVYMALTALDFPFCFLAVRALGTERIGHYEHVVVQFFKNLLGLGKHEGHGIPTTGEVAEAAEGEGWGEDIEEADANNQGPGASIWTQLALAYAIHKSFIFIRVPLAVSITPKIVKILRKRGWDIGKRKPKSP